MKFCLRWRPLNLSPSANFISYAWAGEFGEFRKFGLGRKTAEKRWSTYKYLNVFQLSLRVNKIALVAQTVGSVKKNLHTNLLHGSAVRYFTKTLYQCLHCLLITINLKGNWNRTMTRTLHDIGSVCTQTRFCFPSNFTPLDSRSFAATAVLTFIIFIFPMAGALTVYHWPMRPIKVKPKKRKKVLHFRKNKKH